MFLSLAVTGIDVNVITRYPSSSLKYHLTRIVTVFLKLGAPVAQLVKRWPTDLAVPSSIPARGKIFSTVNGAPLHTAFHYQPLIVLI